jgi:ankyrin repeat protein
MNSNQLAIILNTFDKTKLNIQDKHNLTPIMFTFKHNTHLKIKITPENFDFFIENSDLTLCDNDGNTPLMLALINNQDLKLTQQQIDYLIKNSNLKAQNNDGNTPLMLAMLNNKHQNLFLSLTQFLYLIENSNLRIQNKDDESPLLIALSNHNYQELNFTDKHYLFLFKNSNLNYINKHGFCPLTTAIFGNDPQPLNLQPNLFNFLIKNTKIKNWDRTATPLRLSLKTITNTPNSFLLNHLQQLYKPFDSFRKEEKILISYTFSEILQQQDFEYLTIEQKINILQYTPTISKNYNWAIEYIKNTKETTTNFKTINKNITNIKKTNSKIIKI